MLSPIGSWRTLCIVCSRNGIFPEPNALAYLHIGVSVCIGIGVKFGATNQHVNFVIRPIL